MKSKIIRILGVVITSIIAGCAGQPQQFSMQRPDEQRPQTVTFPNGTVFGGASGQQASSLAQLIVDSNNNNMKDYEQLQGMSSKNLQTSQHALQMLEHMSQQQGIGEIRLFFQTGSATCLKRVAIPTAHQFRRLPVSYEPGPQSSVRHDRQRVDDRKHERQPAALAGAVRGAGTRHRPVPG